MSVELKTCYWWLCDDCGCRNFEMPVKAEFGDGEREAAYRKFHGLDEWSELPDGWDQFEMVTIPDHVTCLQCGSNFLTDDERTHRGGESP